MRIRTRLLSVALVTTAAVGALAAPAFAAGAEPKFDHESAAHCFDLLKQGGSVTVDDCQKAPSPLKPANNEIIWGSAAFLVLLLAMIKWGVPAVRNMEKAREDRIRTDLETAERAKAEAETSLAQYRAQIANAIAEAQAIIDKARQDAENVRRELIARAEADANEIRQKASDDIRLATERAKVDLQRQVATMSVELASKIVERNLDQTTQQQLIDSYIASVGSN
jgi:F-type H+-transporting ATPase subunit b